MKLSRHLSLAAVLLAVGAFCSAAEITVYAAASLSDVFKELAPQFTAASGHTIKFNFGASGMLARQIKEGAPADAIFSADELRIDQLEKAGLLRAGTRQNFLLNTLVLVIPVPPPVPVTTPTELTKPEIRRIAIGEPATVPVGTYTKEYLQENDLWKLLLDKMVPLDSVRSVLAAVESANAEAGFVYKTDALISKKVRIAVEIQADKGPLIKYPGAVIKDSQQPEAAEAFLLWLKQPAAQAAFTKYGFVTVK